MSIWLAALIVGAAVAVIASISISSGATKLKRSGSNFEPLAGALVALAVASVARVIDSVLPGFQHEFTRAKIGPAYR